APRRRSKAEHSWTNRWEALPILQLLFLRAVARRQKTHLFRGECLYLIFVIWRLRLLDGTASRVGLGAQPDLDEWCDGEFRKALTMAGQLFPTKLFLGGTAIQIAELPGLPVCKRNVLQH